MNEKGGEDDRCTCHWKKRKEYSSHQLAILSTFPSLLSAWNSSINSINNPHSTRSPIYLLHFFFIRSLEARKIMCIYERTNNINNNKRVRWCLWCFSPRAAPNCRNHFSHFYWRNLSYSKIFLKTFDRQMFHIWRGNFTNQNYILRFRTLRRWFVWCAILLPVEITQLFSIF